MAMDGLPQIEDLSLLPLTRHYPDSGNAYSDYPFTAFKPKENNLTSTQTENGHVNNRGHEADVREIQGKTLLLGNGPSPDICSVGKNTSTHVWYRTIPNGAVRGAPTGGGTDKPSVPKVGAEVGKPSDSTQRVDAAPEIPTYEYDTRKRKWVSVETRRVKRI